MNYILVADLMFLGLFIYAAIRANIWYEREKSKMTPSELEALKEEMDEQMRLW